MAYSQLMSEFPTFDTAYLPTMPEGFKDTSWHNSTCPCFTHDARKLAIYVDYAAPELREVEGVARFALFDIRHGREIIATDDWSEILAALA